MRTTWSLHYDVKMGNHVPYNKWFHYFNIKIGLLTGYSGAYYGSSEDLKILPENWV